MVEDGTNCNVEEDLDNFYSFVVEIFNECRNLGPSPKHFIECIGDLIDFSYSNLPLFSSTGDMSSTINCQGSKTISNPYK